MTMPTIDPDEVVGQKFLNLCHDQICRPLEGRVNYSVCLVNRLLLGEPVKPCLREHSRLQWGGLGKSGSQPLRFE